MEDLIKRDDAIKELYSQKRTLLAMDADRVAEGVQIAINIIQSLPSAESTGDLDNAIYEYVKEGLMANPYDRPQGEWKSVKASIYPYGYDVECSICGHRMGSSFGYKFCPNCGCRMKGADDE